MIWAQSIELAIQAIESADFLKDEQKQDISTTTQYGSSGLEGKKTTAAR